MTQAEKMNVKTGDQIIYEASNIIGKAIGLFTKSKYSHTGTIVVIGGFVFVLEAKATGVILISFWDSVEKKKYKILRLARPLVKEKMLIDDLRKITAQKYDYNSFFKHTISGDGFLAKTIRKIFAIKITERKKVKICSALSVWLIETYGDFFDVNVNSATFVPDDFITDTVLTELFI